MPNIKNPKNHETSDIELSQIDKDVIDTEYKNTNFPQMEQLENALVWPEGPKGGIDLKETYEVSSIPLDPDTPMESVDVLTDKGVMPK